MEVKLLFWFIFTSPSSEGEVGARHARRVGVARRQPRAAAPAA